MRLASAAQILFVPINDKFVTLKNLNARARASLCACACEVDGNSASGRSRYKKNMCLKLGFVKWFFYICKSIVKLKYLSMSTNVQIFHLSSECRYILYRLRAEIDFQLDKDVTGGWSCSTRCLGNLLPLIYQAFIKIWCAKDKPLTVKKNFRSVVGFTDTRKVLIDYDDLQRLINESNAYHVICKDVSNDLPF